MMLSEAIRLGAMMHPQGKYALARDGRTCALGAALAAIGKLPDGELIGEVDLFLAYQTNVVGILGIQAGLVSAIIMRNDVSDQTREQIADWLAGSGQDLAIPRTENATARDATAAEEVQVHA